MVARIAATANAVSLMSVGHMPLIKPPRGFARLCNGVGRALKRPLHCYRTKPCHRHRMPSARARSVVSWIAARSLSPSSPHHHRRATHDGTQQQTADRAVGSRWQAHHLVDLVLLLGAADRADGAAEQGGQAGK